MSYRRWIAVTAGILLGLVFLTSGIGKIAGQSSLFISIHNLYIFPDIVRTLIVYWLPWGEVLLGLALVVGVASQAVSLISCVLVACFMYQNTWMIMNGFKNEPCSCFGILDRILEGRLSTMNSLYIDIGMLVLALLIYFLSSGGFREWRPWFLRQSGKVTAPAGVQ